MSGYVYGGSNEKELSCGAYSAAITLITKQVDFIRSPMANLCWQLIDKALVRTNYRNEAHELLKAW
ncbi:hypothetical protein T11_1906 [Trichinella zimbabwensis]|uniref:Uncharacterized protein n=1 Tax=Trichinella zimbabwensis TaxID=268475 RepID=A0A0V1HN52_9BILA|nr:hypothetical protein T11_1906 [Trichinella zimbabwensis]